MKCAEIGGTASGSFCARRSLRSDHSCRREVSYDFAAKTGQPSTCVRMYRKQPRASSSGSIYPRMGLFGQSYHASGRSLRRSPIEFESPPNRFCGPIFDRIVHRRGMRTITSSALSSLFDLAREVEQSPESFPALESVLRIHGGHARCSSTPQLQEKFGVAEENDQFVVSVTDIWTGLQVWWNAERIKKPQTFKAESAALPDSTNNGKNCDFCNWETLTATDSFGRVENKSCVTASNLFKYAFPCHGVVLFKHHNPLSFSEAQVRDLLCASSTWFERACQAHSQAQWPLFLWNCLPRAGASQFHGHAQTILTEIPTPVSAAWVDTLHSFRRHSRGGTEYPVALQEAYQSIGLLREVCIHDNKSSCLASLAPTKDMEVVIFGEKLTCPAFSRLLHHVLRAFIDRLSVTSFNLAILNISAADSSQEGPIIARVVSRGSLSSKASDFGALEVFGGASIGHTDPFAVMHALDAEMGASSD